MSDHHTYIFGAHRSNIIVAEATLIKNAGHFPAGYTDFPESLDDYVRSCQQYDGQALPLYGDYIPRIPQWSHPAHILGRVLPDATPQPPSGDKAITSIDELATTNTAGQVTTEDGRPFSAKETSPAVGISLKAATSHLTKHLRQIFTRARTARPY